MATPPFVTVVIPTRDRAHLLRGCLDGVLSQSYPPDRFEVFVVNDRCTDETPEVVHQLERGGARVRHILNRGVGINAARNTGILTAEGDAILLIDDDEIAPPELLKRLMTTLVRQSWAAAAGGGYRTLLEGPAPRHVCFDCLRNYKAYSTGQDGGIAEVSNIPGGCALIWRETLAKYGLFDERLSGTGDDSEWCHRVSRAGGRFVFVHGAYVHHRVHGTELTVRALLRRHSDLGAHVTRWVDPEGGQARREFVQAARFLAHGIRRACVVGFARALDRFLYGVVWPLARYRSRKLAGIKAPAISEG